MQPALSQFWKRYYSDPAILGQAWLDLSNSRVQLQSISLCLEAAGDVLGRACVDVGCGRGQLSRALKALGAGSVLGVDLVEQVITENRRSFPEIDWIQGDLLQSEFMESLPVFDRIFLVEVLQYVDMARAVRSAWRCLHPGGRLVCMVPNRSCPLVARAMARFEGRYLAVEPAAIASLAGTLEDLAGWAGRGLIFQHAQLLLPYEVSAWSTDLVFDEPPNRLNLVFVKAGECR